MSTESIENAVSTNEVSPLDKPIETDLADSGAIMEQGEQEEEQGETKAMVLDTPNVQESNQDEAAETKQKEFRSRSRSPRRSRDDDGDNDVNMRTRSRSPRRRSRSPTQNSGPISVRGLVATKEAGVVIGRGGANVAEIRQLTGAKVNVSENVFGAPDRVVTITGTPEQVARGVATIAKYMIKESLRSQNETVSDDDMYQSHPTAFRLLTPNSRAGAIIGRSGAKLREINETSGARIQISHEPLPMSSERVINIHGSVSSIEKATLAIAEIFRERHDGTVKYFKPTPTQQSNPRSQSSHSQFSSQSGYSQQQSAPTTGSLITQQVYVPNDMVGSIIGKGGARINEIRNMSGCKVVVSETVNNFNDRLITVTGTMEQNHLAVYLIYSRMENDRAKRNTGVGANPMPTM